MKKIKKVQALLFLCAMLISTIKCENLSFAEGFTLMNGNYYYINKNGEAYTNRFAEVGNDKYYLLENGIMARDMIIEHENSFYFADPLGQIVKNRFIDIDNNIALRSGVEEGRYYAGPDGKLFRKKGSSFKKTIGASIYAFDENGRVLTGFIDEDGSEIVNEDGYVTDAMYYADEETGALKSNAWLDLSNTLAIYNVHDVNPTLGSKKYDDLSHMWMYFDQKGKKIKSNDDKERKKAINGVTYAFDENGVMISGFTNSGSIDITQPNNPTITKLTYSYGEENNGALLANQWIWTYPSEIMDQTENADYEYHWWRTDNNGKILNNTIKEINNKKYVFDGIGRLKAGFVLTDNDKKFVANFKSEDLTKEDFLYGYDAGGRLYGHELADMRYFGDDDIADGVMRTGKQKITLSDGTYEFNFGNIGIAKGTRNKIKKDGKFYYLNGLKLIPNDGFKYGIVKVSNTQYKAIKVNGSVIKASKKAILDDEGNYILIHGNELVGYKTDNSIPGSDTIIKWRNSTSTTEAGFWYYDKSAKGSEDKWHYGICVPATTTSISASDVATIPTDIRVNFR